MANSFSHLSFGALTDVGVKRKNNEDSIVSLPDHGVYCVADGMGGAQGGEVASHAAVTCLAKAFDTLSSPAVAAGIEQKARIIDKALNQASKWIKQRSDRKGISGAGTTAVALAFDGRHPAKAIILHAGDSRAYRFRDNQLEQLSKDHTVAAAAGLDDDSKLPSMFKGVVTRAVGVKARVELERTPVDVRAGDVYLLSSDGLDKLVPDPDIEAMIRNHGDGNLNELARQLVDLTNSRGGVDNVSVILVRVGEAPAPGTILPEDDGVTDEVPTGEIPLEETATVDLLTATETGEAISDEFDFNFDEDDLVGTTPSRDSRSTSDSRPLSGPGGQGAKKVGSGIGDWLTENTLLIILGVVLLLLLLAALQFFNKMRGQDQQIGFVDGIEDFDDRGVPPRVPGPPSARTDERDADQILAEIEMSMGGSTATQATAVENAGPDAAAAAAEAERLEQERLEKERAAAEAARLEKERAAAEAARLEQARTEQERQTAEAARLEQARMEQERQAAEAARLEQERQAVEMSARMADAKKGFPDRILQTQAIGAWGSLADAVGSLGERIEDLVEDSGQAPVYTAWTAAWNQADANRADLATELSAVHDAVAGRCADAGFPAPPAPDVLAEGDDPANRYCASLFAIQDALITPARNFLAQHTRQLDLFQPRPTETFTAIWWMAGFDEPDTIAKLTGHLADVRNALTNLEQWLDGLPEGPVPAEVLALAPVQALPQIAESMDLVWNQTYMIAYNLPRQLAVWRNWEDDAIAPLLDEVDGFQYDLVLDREEFGQDAARTWRLRGNHVNFAGLVRSINKVYPLLRQKTDAANR